MDVLYGLQGSSGPSCVVDMHINAECLESDDISKDQPSVEPYKQVNTTT